MSSTDPLRAELRPVKSWQKTEDVVLVARTSRDKVRIVTAKRETFSVDRFRLYTPRIVGKVSARIDAAEIDRLPWEGKSADPLERVREAEQMRGEAFL